MMLDEIGVRSQESMTPHASILPMNNFAFPLKGVIRAVYYKDSNPAKQTLADIDLLGGYPRILRVPFMAPKMNKDNGEYWSPDAGDVVVVVFINGKFNEPLVTGYVALAQPMTEDDMHALSTQVVPGKGRYHRRCNKTDLVIDKDGNRIEYIEKDETVTIKGHETVTIQTGDITVTATAGKCTVAIKGKTAWRSDGTIELDGTAGTGVKGIVQGDCICPITRMPHVHISASVKGSK